MKITDIQLIPAGKYLFVRIDTDAGIHGTGEAGVWGLLDAAAGAVKKYAQYLVGEDPMRIEHLWQYMYRGLYFRGSVVMSAIGALDIALWDIKGKALGVPVYELLGGKCRNQVRCYAPVFAYTADDMAQGCADVQKQGFTAARLIIPDLSAAGREKKPTPLPARCMRILKRSSAAGKRWAVILIFVSRCTAP